MTKKLLLLHSLSLLFFFKVNAQYTQHTMLPSDTDPAITLYNNSNHYCYYPLSTPLNKLMVWYPGTGGVPQNTQLLQQTVANMGYHVISLRYPNDISVNATCPPSDVNCPENWRREVFDGTDRSTYIDVNRANCIENRLIKVLKYLHNHYPTENWDQYWSGDSTVLWCNIVVAGHSQGGGHAAMTSKYYEVNKCVMLSWTDWASNSLEPAPWISVPGPTPAENYYAFIHQLDDIYAYGKVDTTLKDLGLINYGPEILADTTATPFNNSHLITTLKTPRNDTTNYHGSVSTSVYTPLDSNGVPVFKPIWEYLFAPPSNGCLSTGATNQKENIKIQVFPNPSSEKFSVEVPTGEKIISIKLFNMHGAIIRQVTTGDMNISDLRNNLYLVTIETDKHLYNRKLLKQ